MTADSVRFWPHRRSRPPSQHAKSGRRCPRRLHHQPHYLLMREVHNRSHPGAEDAWAPAPGPAAFTPEMLSKTRLLCPMFWRRAPAICMAHLHIYPDTS